MAFECTSVLHPIPGPAHRDLCKRRAPKGTKSLQGREVLDLPPESLFQKNNNFGDLRYHWGTFPRSHCTKHTSVSNPLLVQTKYDCSTSDSKHSALKKLVLSLDPSDLPMILKLISQTATLMPQKPSTSDMFHPSSVLGTSTIFQSRSTKAVGTLGFYANCGAFNLSSSMLQYCQSSDTPDTSLFQMSYSLHL